MNWFHMAVIAAAMAVLIALGIGPAGIGPTHAEAEPVIRPDGVVEMVRPDGSVAASLAVEIAESPRRAPGAHGKGPYGLHGRDAVHIRIRAASDLLDAQHAELP